MKKLKALLASLALVLGLAGLGFAADYEIDGGHSNVMFKVKHLVVSTVTGKFDKFSGSFNFDPKKVGDSKVSVTIESASVNTGSEARDKHLRAEDFFAADKHPQVTFKSTKVSGGAKKFKVAGDLTIRGVTKPVVLDVEYGGSVKDPWGNDKAGFTATAKINRKDFGVSWNKVLDGGGLAVSDEVQIVLEIEANVKKAEAKK